MPDFFILIIHSLLFLLFTFISFLAQSYFWDKNNLISEIIRFFYIYLISFYVIFQQSKVKVNNRSVISILSKRSAIRNNQFVDLMSVFNFGIRLSKLSNSEKILLVIKVIFVSLLFSLISSYVKMYFHLNSYLFFFVIFSILILISSLFWITIKSRNNRL
jgi:lipoprotein signal peptidase